MTSEQKKSAGRPKLVQKKARLDFFLEDADLKRIDNLRGDVTRSAFFRRMVLNTLSYMESNAQSVSVV